MKIIVPFLYEAKVVKPRCRKAVPVIVRDQVEVEIKEMKKSDFPVAVKVGKDSYHWDGCSLWSYYYHAAYQEKSVTVSASTVKGNTENGGETYKWSSRGAQAPFKNFWQDAIERDYRALIGNKCLGSTWLRDDYVMNKDDITYRKWESDNRDQVVEFAHRIAAGLRIYNGKMYQQSGEPFYEVTTFALSNNHGGTALFIHTTRNTSGRERYQFSALEHDTALAYATQAAESRGDTKSLPMRVNCGNKIRVFIPDAIKFKRSDDAETEVQQRLAS
jgi:hypothetical protein